MLDRLLRCPGVREDVVVSVHGYVRPAAGPDGDGPGGDESVAARVTRVLTAFACDVAA